MSLSPFTHFGQILLKQTDMYLLVKSFHLVFWLFVPPNDDVYQATNQIKS